MDGYVITSWTDATAARWDRFGFDLCLVAGVGLARLERLSK
jgi:hypothetical protein